MALQTDKVKQKKEIQIFLVYCVWNIIRYIIIAVAIFLANKRNIHEINKIREYCCDCFYVSQTPTQYDVADDLRFDLSYCIPECTDCNYCKTYFNNDAQASFNYTGDSCPMTAYTGGDRAGFSWDWDSKTGCHSHISYKSFTFFAKSYTAYGIWSIVTSCLYSLGLMGVMYYVSITPNLAMILLRWILIYNILISEIFLYLLFKPFQYYHRDFQVGTPTKDIVCEINSIHDQASEVISWAIYLSVGLMTLHFIYIMYRICCYCILCVQSRKHSNRMRQYSVDIRDMHKQTNYGTNRDTFNLSMIKYRFRWDLCGIIVAMLMLFFLGVSIYATYKMIQAGHEEYDEWKITVISFVMALIFLSLIDNPWVLIKIKILFGYCCAAKTQQKNSDNATLMLHSMSSQSLNE